MAKDMLVRNLSANTIDAYTYQVDRFVDFTGRPVGLQPPGSGLSSRRFGNTTIRPQLFGNIACFAWVHC